jgi:hypothetical protein
MSFIIAATGITAPNSNQAVLGIDANKLKSQFFNAESTNSSDLVFTDNSSSRARSLTFQSKDALEIKNPFPAAKVTEISTNEKGDQSILLEVEKNNQKYYLRLYGLNINKNIQEGQSLNSEQLIGKMGNFSQSTNPEQKFLGIKVLNSAQEQINPSVLFK